MVDRWHRPLLLILCTALLAGCSSAPSAGAPVGEPAREIADLMWIMVAIGGVVYLVVVVLLLLAMFHRRGKADADERSPRLLRGRRLVVLGGIALPGVVIVVLMGLTLAAMRTDLGTADETLSIRVTGHQWWWGVEYQDSGIQTANEIHVPVGRPVRVELTTDNVIHSLWVPALGGKIDMIPGKTNELTLRVDEPGVYGGKCAEYCGLQHTKMAFVVVAMEPAAFEDWQAARLAAVREREAEQLSAGLGLFLGAGCDRCHTIGGTVADGRVGPDLTHLGERLTLGAGSVENDRGNLARWIADPSSVKPGVKMPPTDNLLTPEQMGVLVDYLEDLE